MMLIVILLIFLSIRGIDGFQFNSFRNCQQKISRTYQDYSKNNFNFVRLNREFSLTKYELKSSKSSTNIDNVNPPRSIHFGIFVILTIYAFSISYAPNSIFSGALNNDLINAIINHPYDGTVNPIYVALFNYFAIIPGIYAALLLPKAKGQKWPAAFFIYGSYALGYFLLGPYLALRDTANTNKQGFGLSIFENKIFLAVSFLFGLYLTYYGLFSDYSLDKYKEFQELFLSNTLVHVSTIDLTILNLAVWDPLKEDMERRGWKGPSALAFTLVPLFGPLVYLFLRPSLKDEVK